MKTFIDSKLTILKADRVLQNSLYLMASTAVMAVFGFVFWLVSARLYNPAQIGLASTLISSATTLSLFSLLGFDNVLVRYLPATHKNPERVIDASILLTCLASLVLSIGFLLALPVISPSLHSLLGGPWRSAFFVVIMLLVTVNTLTDSVFIGWQAAKYILLADTGLSVAKVGLPIVLVGLGTFGIFTGYAVAVTVATVISLAALAKRYGYWFRPVLHRETVRNVRSFSAGAYLANLAQAAPMMVLPIMATDVLGASAAAFFNLAMTIATLLFIIPRATANSLFAESSKASAVFARQYGRSIAQTALILVPAVALMLAAGPLVLRVFGTQYVHGSTLPLQILAVSGLSLAFNSIATIALKIRHALKSLIVIEVVGTLVMLLTAAPLMKTMGVSGAAWAWTAGQLVMSAALAVAAPAALRRSVPAFEVAAGGAA